MLKPFGRHSPPFQGGEWRRDSARFAVVLVMMCAVYGAFAQGPPTRPRIAVFSGPTATIQNSPPLVTGKKGRTARGLPQALNPDGSTARFEPLVPQRLAAPVEVYIEQFSAHPLEHDAASLYGQLDGYLDTRGTFSPVRRNPDDRPVYKVTLRPEDGLYPLPYVAVQSDGTPWEGNCKQPMSPPTPSECRQTFYPDASRIFEEIDRGISGRSADGRVNQLASKANFDFYRAVPSGGYARGLAAADRTDIGDGDIPAEKLGQDYFSYGNFISEPRLEDLARATNVVQNAADSGKYSGLLWLEGSPTVTETAYWLSLLIDTKLPIAANAAQRVHGALGSDGGRNIVDSVDYLTSKVWAASTGEDVLGAVVIQDEMILSARQAEKEDARPGGYRAAGSHGGVLGTIGDPGPPTIYYRPGTLHTGSSEVNLRKLPRQVSGARNGGGRIETISVDVKDAAGRLLGNAIPKVSLVRYARWGVDSSEARADEEVEVLARIAANLGERPLAGFVAEGMVPYGAVQPSLAKALDIAAFSGMPVVRVSRGDQAGMVAVNAFDLTIEGGNLTAGKARLLLMAAMMKFGALPPAADPRNPTPAERKGVQEKIQQYQQLFLTH